MQLSWTPTQVPCPQGTCAHPLGPQVCKVPMPTDPLGPHQPLSSVPPTPTGRARRTEQGPIGPLRAAGPGLWVGTFLSREASDRFLLSTGWLQGGVVPRIQWLRGSCLGPLDSAGYGAGGCALSQQSSHLAERLGGCGQVRKGLRPTSRLRGTDNGQQEQEDSGPQGCSCQTRHLGEKCPSPLSAPRFIPKA